jgi:hypothetical protein
MTPIGVDLWLHGGGNDLNLSHGEAAL